MPSDDIPEVPPYPRQHSVDLYPFLEAFRSAQGRDLDTQDSVENFGAVPECRPIPARHEVALSSSTELSTPIPDMGAGSQAMKIPVAPEYAASASHPELTPGQISGVLPSVPLSEPHSSTRQEQVELESRVNKTSSSIDLHDLRFQRFHSANPMSSRRSIGSERGLQLLSIGLATFYIRILVLVLTAKL